jgi:hypothetical protein
MGLLFLVYRYVPLLLLCLGLVTNVSCCLKLTSLQALDILAGSVLPRASRRRCRCKCLLQQ